MAQMLGSGDSSGGGLSSFMESLPMGLGGGMGLFASNEQKQPSQPVSNYSQFSIPQVAQQALGQKPWANSNFDSYIKQLMNSR